MTNKWIAHVKRVQKQTGLPYSEAMVVAKKSYKPVKGTGKRRRIRGAGVVDSAKKYYGAHKSKIHAAGAVAGTALAGLLAANHLRNRRKHGTLERYMREIDNSFVMP